jgi:hypothetical protein
VKGRRFGCRALDKAGGQNYGFAAAPNLTTRFWAVKARSKVWSKVRSKGLV